MENPTAQASSAETAGDAPVSTNSVLDPGAVDKVVEHEEIARLAYSYWDARGFQGGSAEEDWFRAEQELKRPTAAAVAA